MLYLGAFIIGGLMTLLGYPLFINGSFSLKNLFILICVDILYAIFYFLIKETSHE